MRKTSWEFKNSELKTEADRKVWSHTSAFEHLSMIYLKLQGLLGMPQLAQLVQNLPANVKDTGDASSVPGLRRSPVEENGNPLQYPCLENPMDRGALAGCSSWGHKELDVTEATNQQQQHS